MERRAYYQSENERLKVETTTGLLVPAAEVEADYAELVKKWCSSSTRCRTCWSESYR